MSSGVRLWLPFLSFRSKENRESFLEEIGSKKSCKFERASIIEITRNKEFSRERRSMKIQAAPTREETHSTGSLLPRVSTRAKMLRLLSGYTENPFEIDRNRVNVWKRVVFSRIFIFLSRDTSWWDKGGGGKG